jgi:hypothetical protein
MEHEWLHPPQWLGVVMSTSQPFAAMPSQSAKPESQAMPHDTPETHVGVACGAEGHMTLQPPHAMGLVTLFSQPFATIPSQSAKPCAHDPIAQLPELHAGAAFGTEQTCEHVPQFALSVEVVISQPFAIFPSQSPKPPLQAATHAPAMHAAAPFAITSGHAFGHVPQCDVEVRRFASHPFAATLSQSANEPLQLEMPHFPALHTLAAFARLQTLPQ